MRILRVSVLSLLIALSNFALTAAPVSVSPDSSPFGYPISTLILPNGTDFTLGATPVDVLRILGARQRELASHVWAYTGFYPNVEADQERGCDTLLITFTNGWVSDLKIVNKHATRVIATNLNRHPAPTRVARK